MSLTHRKPSVKHPAAILPAKFDSESVTKHASLAYLENFKQKTGFYQLLEENISYNKYHNSSFSTADTIDFMVNASIQGFSRFNQMDELRRDNAYIKIKGKAPSEKVCRDLLLDLPEQTKSELRRINKQVLSLKAKSEGCRDVAMDIDDTVCTVYGDQEGAGVGYNPTKKGRASFKEKVGVLATTHEIINLTLEDGRHHTNYELESFIRKCRLLLPAEWKLKRVRIDSGGFDIDNLQYLDGNDMEFVIKCKKYKSLQIVIDAINRREHLYPWLAIDDMFSVNEIHFSMPGWEKPYRFVLVRKPAPVKDKKQLKMELDAVKYDYQIIVTNIEYLSTAEIFHEYNQRCNIENKIDEFKEGFAFDQTVSATRNATSCFY